MIFSILSLLPKPLKSKLNAVIKKRVVKYLKLTTDQTIPKIDIPAELLKNTTVLANRKDMLRYFPKNGVVAELGVNKGGFSEEILKHTNPKKLHLVDFWGSKRYNQEIRKGVEEKFKEELASGSVEINLGLSTDVVHGFKENYFDWIYIDTDHTYKTTKAELEMYASKMKSGGIMAGHDYTVCNWNSAVRYGVIEAVHEFCIAYNWEIMYLSMEMTVKPSFAIRKVN